MSTVLLKHFTSSIWTCVKTMPQIQKKRERERERESGAAKAQVNPTCRTRKPEATPLPVILHGFGATGCLRRGAPLGHWMLAGEQETSNLPSAGSGPGGTRLSSLRSHLVFTRSSQPLWWRRHWRKGGKFEQRCSRSLERSWDWLHLRARAPATRCPEGAPGGTTQGGEGFFFISASGTNWCDRTVEGCRWGTTATFQQEVLPQEAGWHGQGALITKFCWMNSKWLKKQLIGSISSLEISQQNMPTNWRSASPLSRPGPCPWHRHDRARAQSDWAGWGHFQCGAAERVGKEPGWDFSQTPQDGWRFPQNWVTLSETILRGSKKWALLLQWWGPVGMIAGKVRGGRKHLG